MSRRDWPADGRDFMIAPDSPRRVDFLSEVERTPHHEEIGRIVVACARLERVLRELLDQQLEHPPYGWVLIRGLTASALLSALERIANDAIDLCKHEDETRRISTELKGLISRARPLLTERNQVAHGYWEPQMWESAMLVSIASSRAVVGRPVTREDLAETAHKVEDLVDDAMKVYQRIGGAPWLQ